MGAFSSRFVVAWADAGPGGEVLWVGEDGHIDADFGQDDGSAVSFDTWDGVQQGILRGEGLEVASDFIFEL